MVLDVKGRTFYSLNMTDEFIINTDFNIRNAKRSDLIDLMMVEQTWPPDQRASADQFLSRLELFPDGFWVGEYQNSIVGLTTSCLQHYDPKDMSRYRSWDHATNKGYGWSREHMSDPNALYVVSTVIRKAYRKQGLFEAFFEKHKAMTLKRGLAYSLTGAMLPGYNTYCNKHGEISAHQYACLHHQGRPVDPLIGKLAALGYEMPDERHLIADYFQSVESRDYAALLVYRNPHMNPA